MRTRTWIWMIALYLFAALIISTALLAQEQQEREHHRYILKDLGTFGGPSSALNIGAAFLNSHGMAVGAAETPMLDPPNSNPFPCGPGTFVYHGLEWQNGVLTDLGALGGADKCSNAQSINEAGEIQGNSENDKIDPLLGVFEIHAVLWKHGQIIDLGTLGGEESAGSGINNRSDVVGFALNTTPDPFSLFDLGIFGSSGGTEARAFMWRGKTMQDLGTLGGPDSAAQFVNDHGQVAGISYTSFTPNPSTGIPTIHPFLWDDGMIDLGSFGGTSGGPTALNNRGQVVGNMDLPGDLLVHPFLWDRGVLKDLGTFGGSNGQALWINDAGEVVGEADFPGDQVHDAFLWKHGVMTDLGNLGRTSFGYYINGRSQVVGHSMVNDGGFRAFLWENGGPMIDLNSLVPSGTSLLLTDAYNINDRGEIAGVGLQPGCSNTDCGHAYVLIPCDENHPGECEDYSMIVGPTLQAAAPTPGSAAITKQNGNSPINQYNQLLNRLMQRYHIPGQSAARRN